MTSEIDKITRARTYWTFVTTSQETASIFAELTIKVAKKFLKCTTYMLQPSPGVDLFEQQFWKVITQHNC